MHNNSYLTLYFSATGNSEFIARIFSQQMNAKCLSIEDDADFEAEIKAHDAIAFCYPIFGSRLPRNLRVFVAANLEYLNGKKIIIFATQAAFSGDGARVLTDLFPPGAIEVIYAEHIKMPSNVNNIPFFIRPSQKAIQKQFNNAEAKMLQICEDIKSGIIKKRGFSRFSRFLGNLQGRIWMGNSKNIEPSTKSAEHWLKNSLKIRKNCTACNLCVKICPVKNLVNEEGKIVPQGNCIVCYRCLNRCPEKAVRVMVPFKPSWQYRGRML